MFPNSNADVLTRIEQQLQHVAEIDAQAVADAWREMLDRHPLDERSDLLRQLMQTLKPKEPSPAPVAVPQQSVQDAAAVVAEMFTKTEKKESPSESIKESKARARRLWQRGAVRPGWKARKRGNIAKDIYLEGGYAMLIRCVNGQVRAAMSKTVLLAFLACSEEADYDGQFEMPAGQLGDRIGCNRRNAQRALSVLLDAGTLRIIHEGGPRTPNVYGLTPQREFDPAKAIEALENASQTATTHAKATLGSRRRPVDQDKR